MGNSQNKGSIDNHQKPQGGGEVKPSSNPGNEKAYVPGEGIRSMKTSSVFRALNFELYARPSKPVMIVGAAAFTICLGYMTYMRYNYDKKEVYEALAEDGTVILRPKKSRWDS